MLLSIAICMFLAHKARCNADAGLHNPAIKESAFSMTQQLSGTPSVDGAAMIIAIDDVSQEAFQPAAEHRTLPAGHRKELVVEIGGRLSAEFAGSPAGAEIAVGRAIVSDADSPVEFESSTEGKDIDVSQLLSLDQRSPDISEVLSKLMSSQVSIEDHAATSSLLLSTDHFGTNSSTLMHLKLMITPDTNMPDTLVTDVQLGRDVILGRKLGSGAMGTVYEATFKDTPVAVKLLSPGADLKSFEHELGILGRTRHPNVIRLLAANLTSSSQPLLVEELAHGSLEE